MKAWLYMVLGLALWMAILAVLAHVPAPTYSPADAAAKWTDFGRTAAASLAGAGFGAFLAFGFNLSVQTRLRRRDELASGIYALATLARQSRDFNLARRRFFEVIETGRVRNPMLPDWEHIRPFFHAMPATADLNIKSLAFVLEEARGEHTLNALHDADQAHRFLVAILERVSKVASKRLEKLEEAGYQRSMAVSYEAHVKVLGPRLSGDLESSCEAAFVHFNEDESRFVRAHRLLRACMQRRFGDIGIPSALEIDWRIGRLTMRKKVAHHAAE